MNGAGLPSASSSPSVGSQSRLVHGVLGKGGPKPQVSRGDGGPEMPSWGCVSRFLVQLLPGVRGCALFCQPGHGASLLAGLLPSSLGSVSAESVGKEPRAATQRREAEPPFPSPASRVRRFRRLPSSCFCLPSFPNFSSQGEKNLSCFFRLPVRNLPVPYS